MQQMGLAPGQPVVPGQVPPVVSLEKQISFIRFSGGI